RRLAARPPGERRPLRRLPHRARLRVRGGHTDRAGSRRRLNGSDPLPWERIGGYAWKTSSTRTLKRRAILNASSRLGEYFSVSIALMVWRDTSSLSARSACDQPRSARRCRRSLRISAVSPAGDREADGVQRRE